MTQITKTILLICTLFLNPAFCIAAPAALPSDLEYTIEKTTRIPNLKLGLDVRLNHKISEQTLKVLAEKLRVDDGRTYARTFILYYLPGMVIDSGAWASTHFNPDLEVKILGLSLEDENKASKIQAPAGTEIVGEWNDERPGMGSRLSMIKTGKKIQMKTIYKDGSSGVEDLTLKSDSRYSINNSNNSDFYKLKKKTLEVGDADGVYLTLQPVQ